MAQGETRSILGELVGPALVAFLAAGVVLTFVVAFALSNGGGGEEEAAGDVTTGEETPGPPPSTEVTIVMIPTIQFDTDTLTIAAGEPVAVLADNQDTGIPHNFAVYTDDSASELIAGTGICNGPCEETLTLELAEPGEYFFRCDVHPIQMVGTLVVE